MLVLCVMVKVGGKNCCKKSAKKAHDELQLAFYLYQHEQIDYCHPALAGHC